MSLAEWLFWRLLALAGVRVDLLTREEAAAALLDRGALVRWRAEVTATW